MATYVQTNVSFTKDNIIPGWQTNNHFTVDQRKEE